MFPCGGVVVESTCVGGRKWSVSITVEYNFSIGVDSLAYFAHGMK
jgi:hypothetical protein